MHRPIIADLSPTEREKLINGLIQNKVKIILGEPETKQVVSALEFYNELETALKSSSVTIAQIKKLLGVYEEKIKKLTRNQ